MEGRGQRRNEGARVGRKGPGREGKEIKGPKRDDRGQGDKEGDQEGS